MIVRVAIYMKLASVFVLHPRILPERDRNEHIASVGVASRYVIELLAAWAGDDVHADLKKMLI